SSLAPWFSRHGTDCAGRSDPMYNTFKCFTSLACADCQPLRPAPKIATTIRIGLFIIPFLLLIYFDTTHTNADVAIFAGGRQNSSSQAWNWSSPLMDSSFSDAFNLTWSRRRNSSESVYIFSPLRVTVGCGTIQSPAGLSSSGKSRLNVVGRN